MISDILRKTGSSWWTRLESGKTRKLQLKEILQGCGEKRVLYGRRKAPREWLEFFGQIPEEHAGLVRSKSAPLRISQS